jgi:mannosylglucosylglycerate synthase
MFFINIIWFERYLNFRLVIIFRFKFIRIFRNVFILKVLKHVMENFLDKKGVIWKPDFFKGFDIDPIEGLKDLLSWSKEQPTKDFTSKDISKLRYGVLHSLFGYPDGVSIVMKQIEGVLIKDLGVSKKNIHYLVGKNKGKNKQVNDNIILWDGHEVNLLALNNYKTGYGGGSSEKIEMAILEAKKVITNFIKKNKIDVLFAHNSCHPVNFIYAVALSRYYRDAIALGEKTPKYIVWWHDSHLERKHFLNPPNDVSNYLLQGIPGNFVEYIIFINSLQFKEGKHYFKQLNKRSKGFFELIERNHDVVYNTTGEVITKFKDLQKESFEKKVESFIKDFKIKELCDKKKCKLKDMVFCLQHTRVVERKRIDFALLYCYELLKELKQRGLSKAMYFLVSGTSAGADSSRKKLEKLNNDLIKDTGIKDLFLVFAEDYYDKTKLVFEDYPNIFAKLGGITTYFSEVEGFGNNLLEVLGSGLIPIIYRYPVYKRDIAKYKFKVIGFDKYELDSKQIDQAIEVLTNKKNTRKLADYNLKILRKNFAHRTMAVKLIRAITSQRGHK